MFLCNFPTEMFSFEIDDGTIVQQQGEMKQMDDENQAEVVQGGYSFTDENTGETYSVSSDIMIAYSTLTNNCSNARFIFISSFIATILFCLNLIVTTLFVHR